jgi:hypothetical protein
MKYLSLLFIAFLLLQFTSLAQLDSVWYQGPSTGSVVSGAMQNTDNFTDEPIQLPFGEFRLKPEYKFENVIEDQRHNLDNSQLPAYCYVEDPSVTEGQIFNGGQTVLLNSFSGFNATNVYPPDPTIAAGPNHLIAMVNGSPSIFRIFDKQGNVLITINCLDWWSPVSSEELGDPQLIYDNYAGRWVISVLQVNFTDLTASNLIAYSDDDDPMGIWYVYRLDTKMHGSVSSNTWGDYPKMGFDDEAIYIMTRCIPFGGGDWYCKIRIISKSELYNSNGGTLTYVDIWDIRKPNDLSISFDVIHPAISYSPDNGGWFFYSAGWWQQPSADYYVLYKITNPLTNPGIRGKVLNTQLYYGPPNANQLGGGVDLEAVGLITRAPIVREDTLYVSHDIQNSTNNSYSSVKYLKVDLNAISIIEQVEFGAIGYFYLYSSLAIDANHNIAITYSRSGDNEYVGAYYSTRHLGDPPALSSSQPIAEGQGNYQLIGNNRNRWGDYMGIYLDPANNYDIWMLTEYAAGTNTWGTYVAQVRMVPFTGVYTFANPLSIDFGDVEVNDTSTVNSVIISNYGDSDLIITDMLPSVGNFNILNVPNLPYTIIPYDTLVLNLNFTPTDTGVVGESFNFTSNDPSFNGFTFTGNGYKIFPALDKTFYASSGIQNSGNILTIDEISGSGNNIGPSLFNSVKSISIHPQTGIMYGLVTGSGSSQIVRINTFEGDSYTLHTLNISNFASAAFDTTGILYVVTLDGDFYIADLVNGTTNFVVDAVSSYSGITFHPGTNELWATTRSFVINKDAIFKVDLVTGDTVIVGNTGLNKLTNAIAFDENYNLFGIIGAENEVADFISIDPLNGIGTIIGSVGFKNILGLAYAETGITDVIYESIFIPDDYVLEQNYPNPFNPSTKIRYSIPQPSNVVIKFFDILGNEIATLINEEKPAGSYEVEINSSDLVSGVYFYRLQAGNFTETKKMILLK